MAKTIQIDGVGKVQVDDSFFNLSPEQQNAQVEEIAKSMGHSAPTAASPSASPAPKAAPKTIELAPEDVWAALVNKESHNTPGAVGPETPYGRAMGLAQTLQGTAKDMAAKVGLPWRPDLLSGTSEDARKYQAVLGKAYFNEGLDKYNGDVFKALQFYHGGPDESKWGPIGVDYAKSIIAAAQGHPSLDAPNPALASPPPAAAPPAPVATTQDVPTDPTDTTDTPDQPLPNFTDAQKAQIMAFLPKAKTGAALDAFVKSLGADPRLSIGTSQQIVDYLRKGGDPSKLRWREPQLQQSPPQPNPDLSPGHIGAVVARGAGQGLVDLPTLLMKGGLSLTAGPTVAAALSKLTDAPQNAYDALTGDFGKPQTTLDKYLGSAAEGVSGMAVPGLGLEDGIANILKTGIGSGIGGQAAHDLFPNSNVAPVIGAILGGGIAHPEARAAVADRSPVGKARFVKNVVNNPLGSDLVQVAQDYKTLADRVHPQGAAPSGRQPLSVEEINAVGDRGLKGIRDKISKSNIPTPQKLLLKEALDHAVEIPLQRTPNMGPDQIALSDLPDTVEGNAVKAAITRAKAGDMLSARYGGQKIGALGKLWNHVVDWGGGLSPLPTPVLNLFKVKGGDINKSRMDAAAKAIKRVPLYQKAATQLPQSNFGPAMAALNDKVMATAQANDLAKAAKAAALAQKAKALAAVQQSNDLISRRVEAKIEKPTDGYRGLIYNQTGVTQPVQDQALLYMVKKGELSPDDLTRVMSDPNSLMRGKSKAGLKIMDRIGQLADQGVIKRDPQWTPPAPDQMPAGVMNWLDAQGNPIRSIGAYAGGIAKNIVRGENPFIDKADSEIPAKPKKTKSKKKQQQGV